ncbi:serine/threonine-protein kinase [Streptomyces sp. NPDC006193]|uniref:serine/threonine-protein kinase n=1 Tax=Streptomyces sp. NPDC006193 TaxID=3155717 RepID=UPI00339EA6C9
MRPGTLVLGRYRIERELGHGGQGTVHRAVDTRLGRRRLVAVKVLHTDPGDPTDRRWMMARRFDREVEILADLHHDHIVTVFDRGEHDGTPLLVMEHVPGSSLAERMTAPVRPTAAEVAAWGAQTASGLLAAHRAGVSHRDVKPSNLLLSAAGLIKICDFGLVTRPRGRTRLTVRGAGVLGSPGYMSPEQAACRPGDARSDVFSLGVTLYAVLAGGSPFADEDAERARTRVLDETPPPVTHWRPDVPSPLSDLLGRMTAREPAARPRLPEVLAALDDLARLPARGPSRQPAQRPAPGPSVSPAGKDTPGADYGRDYGPDGGPDDGPDERNVPTGVPDGLTAVYWPRLEAAEGLLARGRWEEADEEFRLITLDITAEGGRAQQHPAFFAALYGRVRALEGRGRRIRAAQRLARLQQHLRPALGGTHPLARVVAAHRVADTP